MTFQTFTQQYLWLLPIVIIWSLAWKGLALYRAARLEQKAWFVVLLLVNTAGILEIFYLFILSKPTVHKTD